MTIDKSLSTILTMKHNSTLFLKTVIIFIAVAVLTGLIWFPQTEGRAKNLDFINIYKDPFIIYTYIGAIPFFIALFQAFKLLNYVDKNKIFSKPAVKTVQNIKYCALAVVAFVAAAIFYIRFGAKGDDPAGPTMMGLVVIFTSTVIATAAGIFQKLLQNALDIKSEIDLTV